MHLALVICLTGLSSLCPRDWASHLSLPSSGQVSIRGQLCPVGLSVVSESSVEPSQAPRESRSRMKLFSTVSPHCCPDRQTDRETTSKLTGPHGPPPPGPTPTFPTPFPLGLGPSQALSSVITIWPLKTQASLCSSQGALWRVFSQTRAFCICFWWSSTAVLSQRSVGQLLSALVAGKC